MKLVSVNCGLPRKVEWHGRCVTTAIYKEPVDGRIALRKLNLDGDRQADLTVHGGSDKAVYCYPAAHYDYWKAELPARKFPLGNLERTLRLRAWLKSRSTSATGFRLVLQRW